MKKKWPKNQQLRADLEWNAVNLKQQPNNKLPMFKMKFQGLKVNYKQFIMNLTKWLPKK